MGVEVRVTNAVDEIQDCQQHRKKKKKRHSQRTGRNCLPQEAGLTTIEKKMKRPVQSWDRQQQTLMSRPKELHDDDDDDDDGDDDDGTFRNIVKSPTPLLPKTLKHRGPSIGKTQKE
jgi:hypothetical protein